MTYDLEELYRLLPAIYRIRDAEQGYPLKALLGVIAEQATAVEADIAQLYDNWFIETCAEWVVPYIGDLLATRNLNPVSRATFSQRARVANTLGYRRRKGTATMLEQLARDTTGWPARVVEFFQLLATTQYLNHPRPQNRATPDLRQGRQLELLNTPFDTIAHTAEVRLIANGRGKYNLPNIGIFLWRLQAYPVEQAPAFDQGQGRYSFSQLGQDLALFNRPVTETDPSHLAEEINVPAPIPRRAFREQTTRYYGPGQSLQIWVDGSEKTVEQIVPCNLSDWQHRPSTTPAGLVAVDPVLGRLAFPSGVTPGRVQVSYFYGFSGDVGGGFYDRALAPVGPGIQRYRVAKALPNNDTVQKVLTIWTNEGRPSAVIQIEDSEVYAESLTIAIPAGCLLELRAAPQQRPVLNLGTALNIRGEPPAQADQPGGQLILDGLWIYRNSANRSLTIQNGDLEALQIRHCTLVPGLALKPDGSPAFPGQPSLRVAAGNARLQISLFRTISGGLVVNGTKGLSLKDSILDGTGGNSLSGGPEVVIEESTLFGPADLEILALASNSLFSGPVVANRKQEGCVRFCFVPEGSNVPRRFRCQPDLAVQTRLEAALKANPLLSQTDQDRLALEVRQALQPLFTERQYGKAAYAQLALNCPPEIRGGAEDQAEMGVFHFLQQAQREANLRTSLDEFLRVGLEAGIFYVS